MSGLLSSQKSSVLHMDRNNYYGAESASLTLDQLYEKFKNEKAPAELGRSRDYNVDLCPKMIMACGNLVKILLSTQVTRYLDFRTVTGSYVVKDGKVHKVPATTDEALTSGLLGLIQKGHFRSFVSYVNNYDQADSKTWNDLDLSKVTARELYKNFSLDEDTITFTGHALALHLDDSYLDQPAIDLIERVKLYVYSLTRYGNSPYIYPVWGLATLPEAFSRLSAVNGGVYMLNRPVEEILYDQDGKVTGVKSGGEVARCKKLLADPTYLAGTDKVKSVGQVVRSICILSHAVDDTNKADSCQIILPASQLKRKSDVYISVASSQHKVASDGKWVVAISAAVEGDSKNAHDELVPALKLLGSIDAEFSFVSDVLVPTGDGSKDNVFVTSSFDATSHFETATSEVIELYERMSGKKIDLTVSVDAEEEAQS